MTTIEMLQDIVERRIGALINLKRMRMEGYKSRRSGSEIDDELMKLYNAAKELRVAWDEEVL